MSIFWSVVIALVVLAIAFWIIGIIPLKPPFDAWRWVLYAIVAIAVIIFLLGLIGVHVLG
jgi:hypothetical protein